MAGSINPYQPPQVHERRDHPRAVYRAWEVGPMLSLSVVSFMACLFTAADVFSGGFGWRVNLLSATFGGLGAVLLWRSFQTFRRVRAEKVDQVTRR